MENWLFPHADTDSGITVETTLSESDSRVEGCLIRGPVDGWGDQDLGVAVAGVSQCAKAHGSGHKNNGEDDLSDETFPVPAGVVEPLDENGHYLLQEQSKAVQLLTSGQDFV